MANKATPRLIHTLVGFSSGIPLGAKKQDQMIDLMVDAIGATKQERKQVEKLAANLLSGFTTTLRAKKRAPLSKAALAWESKALRDRVRQRRSKFAGKGGGYYDPYRGKAEYAGQVDLVGKGGYSHFTEIAELLELSKKQLRRARELVGRPLGKVALRDNRSRIRRVVDLAQMWDHAAARSAAAARQIESAKSLMAASSARRLESMQALRQADKAKLAGNGALESKLSRDATKAEDAANRLRATAAEEGSRAYRNVANQFWADVHADAQLCEYLESLGLTFTMHGNQRSGVPYFKIGNSKERMTLEHFSRRSDDPVRAIDSSNLIISPSTENSVLNELIRKFDPFNQL